MAKSGGNDGVTKKKNGIKINLSVNKRSSRNKHHNSTPIRTTTTIIPQRRRQRQQHQPTNDSSLSNTINDNDDDIFDIPLPNDTLLMIQSIIQRGSAAHCTAPFPSPASPSSSPGVTPLSSNNNHNDGTIVYPFVLRRMIFAASRSTTIIATNNNNHDNRHETINDALLRDAVTATSEEFDELATTNAIRRLYMNDNGDVAVMETETYIRGIGDAFAGRYYGRRREDDGGKEGTTTLERIQCAFIAGLSLWTGFSVTEEHMLRPQNSSSSSSNDNNSTSGSSSCLTKRDIDILVRMGLLLPKQSKSSSPSLQAASKTASYYFTLPTMGQAAKEMEKGRRHLLNKLKRSYRGELSRCVLEQSRFSDLSSGFHVRDALSCGWVVLKERPGRQMFVALAETKNNGGR